MRKLLIMTHFGPRYAPESLRVEGSTEKPVLFSPIQMAYDFLIEVLATA